MTITGPTTTGTPLATIDGQKKGRIFNITRGVTVTLKYLTITNGNYTSGGGIYNNGDLRVIGCYIIHNNATQLGGAIVGGGIHNNNGTLTVTGSNINHNTAGAGGGIYNHYSNFTVTNSNINHNTAIGDCGGILLSGGNVNVINSNINYNTAAGAGGGIYNHYSNFTVTNSNINHNTAGTNGGGIYNRGTANLTVTNSNIQGNTANSNGGGIYYTDTGNLAMIGCNLEFNKATINGNAFYNSGGDISNLVVHFNRFFNPATGYEIYSENGQVDASYNWWGSNSNPSDKVSGNVDTNPWIILNINSSPSLIGKNVKSSITADLTRDSSGNYHNPTNGHLPDNMAVKFTTTRGTINAQVYTLNGSAKAVLTGGSTSGSADVFALLDDQIRLTKVTIETTPPTITRSDPTNNAVKVAASKTIKITFSENIKLPSNFWIELLNSSNKAISFNKPTVSGKILTIDPKSKLAESKYRLILHIGAVTDLAGNPVAAKTITFSVGTSPTVASSDPKHGTTKVARSKTIKVTFSEKIKAGTNYRVELKDSSGKLVTIKKAISGKVLTITHTAKLKANTKYTLTMYTGSVTDLAGNPLAAKTITFTTGST